MNFLIRSLLMASLCIGAANAGIVFYTSSAEFQAAANISNTADFEGQPVGTTTSNPIFDNGIRFQLLAGATGVHTIYIDSSIFTTLSDTCSLRIL